MSKRGNSRLHCAVAQCRNYGYRTIGVMYHTFPKNEKIKQEWVSRCKRPIKFNPNNARICSMHFMPSDYKRDLKNELLGLPVKKILHPNAVPSQLIPDGDGDTPIGGPSTSEVAQQTSQLEKCPDNIKTKRKRNLPNKMRQSLKTDSDSPPAAAPTPELELVVPHLDYSVELGFESDADGIRPPPVLSTTSESVAEGSSFNAQGEALPLSPHLGTRESLLEEELEMRIKRHRFQLECDEKLQSLQEMEHQILVESAREKRENIRKEEERRRQSFEWEEDRKREAFEWKRQAFEREEEMKRQAFEKEEERKKKTFVAEERRKEEMHLLQMELKEVV